MDESSDCKRRSNDVFAALDGYEKDYKAYLATPESRQRAREVDKFDPNEEPRNIKKRTRTDNDEDDGDVDDVGLTPAPVSSAKKSFNRDPSKWTEYTLSDVTEEQMSDGACRRAAFDFLRSRGILNKAQVDEGEFDHKKVFGVAKKNEFKKPKDVRPLDTKSFAYRLDELDEDMEML